MKRVIQRQYERECIYWDLDAARLDLFHLANRHFWFGAYVSERAGIRMREERENG